MVKQVIVMRKDLNMRKGKMVAQGAHASMKVFFDKIKSVNYNVQDCGDYSLGTRSYNIVIDNISKSMKEWVEGIFTKICVSVDSEKELLDIYNKAKEADIPCSLIQDCGATEFKGVPTYTCCAIGPDEANKIDIVTGHLKLL